MSKKSNTPLASKHVPYLNDRVLEQARPFLPTGPTSALSSRDVDTFVSRTVDDPDTRMAVLGVLRAHANNGAEVILSLFALLLSVLSVAFSLLRPAEAPSWVGRLIVIALAIFILVAVMQVIRMAAAAHARKITAIAWLGAYEDGLRQMPTRPVPTAGEDATRRWQRWFRRHASP
ncbi:hypothetical protein IFT90_15750 [Frigoribacterium sp. CFBP 8766]|uniref:hypothetical protein n=1 Tax=Frigoribacterium sp. CFBP 8766 TaxID=2775273 RepID=UPI00177CCC73|nr:hypothetical protein [Frigoribacterium sp. CFBP 8766]MBD8586010.1 hypothetical protein [Frigoribacterium sp. CFBP 8766]